MFQDASKSITLSTSSASANPAMYGQSIWISGTTTSGNSAVDTNGNFIAFFDVPDLAYNSGTGYNVYGVYTPSASGSATAATAATLFQITPYIDLRLGNDATELCTTTSSGTATGCASPSSSRTFHWGEWVRVRLYGFGDTETVTLSGLPVAGASVTMTTNAAGYASGTSACTTNCATVVRLIGETTGGSKTLTATGQTTSATATKSFTIVPSIALYPSQTGQTYISIPASAPSTFYIAGHGFANAETISALTVNGVSASISALTTGTNGGFGISSNSRVAVVQTTAPAFGAATIVITASTTASTSLTFSYAGKNVLNPYTVDGTAGCATVSSSSTTPQEAGCALTPPSTHQSTALNMKASVPILASNTQSSGTGIIQFANASPTVGAVGTSEDQIWATGYTSAATISSVTWNSGKSTSATLTTYGSSLLGSNAIDANGASVQAWSTLAARSSTTGFDNGLTTMPYRGANTITVSPSSGASAGATSISVVPAAGFVTGSTSDLDGGYGVFDNTSCTGSSSVAGCIFVRGAGFGNSATGCPGLGSSTCDETLSLTIGSKVVSTSFVTSGVNTFGYTAANIPDIAGGTYTVTVAGGTSGDSATATGTNSGIGLVILPNVDSSLETLTGALSVASVSAGSTVVLVSGATSGIHGLTASGAYSVFLDGPSGTLLTTFTATSSGYVPAATQFTVPSATAGRHIVDLVLSGASVVEGNTPAVQGNINVLGPGSGVDEYTFKALQITITAVITATPSAGGTGTSVTVTGTALSASTAYTVQTGDQVSYSSFTSSATGAIPSAVTFKFPTLPTCTAAQTTPLSCSNSFGTSGHGELGTAYTLYMVSSTETPSTADGSGTFLLQASLGLNATSGVAGSGVLVTANGLFASSSYDVIWNAGQTSNGAATGTIVAAFTTNSVGSGTATVTIPSGAAAGTYPISLMRVGESLGSTSTVFVISTPPSFTVTTAPTGGLNTSTLTPSGSAAEASVSGQATVSQSFKNTLSSSLSVYMWVSVKNSAGQTVGVFLGSATLAAGATVQIAAALFNLPSGTYTASVFVTTTSGTVVSTTSTTSSFSV